MELTGIKKWYYVKFLVSCDFLFRESPNLHHEPEVRDNPSSLNATEAILKTKALERRRPR